MPIEQSAEHKNPFRAEDPFKKDRDLIYKHIGVTKRLTWNYQYFVSGFLLAAILVYQLFKLVTFIRSRKDQHQHQRQRTKLSFIQKRIIQCKSFLASPPPSQFLTSWFGTTSNFIIISIFYSINTFITFYDLPFDDAFNLALRFGLVSASNLPLLYLIPLKNGPMLYLLNQSYENILVFHKSVGVLVLLTALVHSFAFCYCLTWTYLLGGVKGITGLFCIGFFIFIGITSTRYVKERWYELFYFMHIVNFVIFLPVFYFHHYVCKPFVILVSGLLIFDRVFRYFKNLWILQCIVHVDEDHDETCIIEIDPYLSNLSKFNKVLNFFLLKVYQYQKKFRYEASNHLFITVPIINLFQSHPFTIASLPSDDKLILVVKVHQGFTRRLVNHVKEHPSSTLTCLINGPYGLSHQLLPNDLKETSIDYRTQSIDVENPDDAPLVYTASSAASLTKDPKPTYNSTSTSSEPNSNQSSFSSLTSIHVDQNSREKIILIAGGTGISLLLPLLRKYESNPTNFDISLIWIIRNNSILNLPYLRQLHQEQIISSSKHVHIWETSVRGRPNVSALLFDAMPTDYVPKIHIIGCGPNALMDKVRDFSMEQMNQLKDPYTEINLILEEFSF